MILLEIVELIDEQTYRQRIEAGAEAQRRVRDELVQRFGKDIKKVKVARVGSKLFDIQANIRDAHQKVEVKSITRNKPYFAFFDTFVTRGLPAGFLDDLTSQITHGTYPSFSEAVDGEPDSGFPCDEEKQVPKSGRVPAVLKKITNPEILATVRERLLADLESKGINYLAIYNRTVNTVAYYHVSGLNFIDAPELPPLRRIYLDTYGAPKVCAMRVVVRVAI